METHTYRRQQIDIILENVYPKLISGAPSVNYTTRSIIRINGKVVENNVGNLGTTPLDDAKEIINRMFDSGELK